MPPPTMAMRGVARRPRAALGVALPGGGAGVVQPAPIARPAVAIAESRRKRRRVRAMSISSSIGGAPGCSRAARAAIRSAWRRESNRGLRDTLTSSTPARARASESSGVSSRMRRDVSRIQEHAQLVDPRQHRFAFHRAIRLRQHLARGAFLHRDENLQLALERAGGGNEIREGVAQRLGRHRGAWPPPGPASDASSARARIASMSAPDRPAGSSITSVIDCTVVVMPLFFSMIRNSASCSSCGLGIEQREVLLGAALALQVDRQQIGPAGDQEPDDLAAILGVAHERSTAARRRGSTCPNRPAGCDRRGTRRPRR